MAGAGGSTTFTAAAALAWIACGCVVEHRPPPRRPPPMLQPVVGGPASPAPGPERADSQHGFAGGSAETTPAVAMPPGVARGRPTTMHPGAPPAVWIWVNPQGVWRLRTTNGGRPMRFDGKVVGISAPLAEVAPSRMELRESLRPEKDGIRFELTTAGQVDGFDFRVSDGGCVRFVVEAGPQNEPRRVFLGAAQLPPPGSHFILCP